MKYIVSIMVWAVLVIPQVAAAEVIKLQHANYSPTDLFYYDFNQAFAAYYREQFGVEVEVHQHPNTTARHLSAILSEGYEADLVTFNSSADINYLVHHSQLIEYDWESAFPNNSSPFTSNVVFLVRKGNPKQIWDWNDLLEKDVHYITTSPKTSGFGRYAYLSLYIYAYYKFGGNEEQIRAYLREYVAKSRGMLESYYDKIDVFIRQGLGDVLLVWEHAALMAIEHHGSDDFELVVPSVSVTGRPRVAVITANALKHGTTQVARAYINYLYSDAGQELAARYYLRPENSAIYKKYSKRYPRIKNPNMAYFGTMSDFYHTHFGAGGWYDQITASLGQSPEP